MPKKLMRLVDRAPELEKIYDSTNREPFESLGLRGSAWWACPLGHRWYGTISTQINYKGSWKIHGLTTCPVCVGHAQMHRFPCGHDDITVPNTERCLRNRRCRYCEIESRPWWEKTPPKMGTPEYQQMRDEIATTRRLYAERTALANAAREINEAKLKAKVAEIMDVIPVHTDQPVSYAIQIRKRQKQAVYALLRTILDISDQQIQDIANLAWPIPTLQQAMEAQASHRPVPLDIYDPSSPMIWANGLIHRYRPRQQRQVVLDPRWLGMLQATLEAHLPKCAGRSVKDGTYMIGRCIQYWARQMGATSYRELTIPIANGCETQHGWGRLDWTILSTNHADIIIEVDSDHKQFSLDKLQWAQRAGGASLWIRWNRGRIVQSDQDVTVIDIKALTVTV